MEDFVETPSSQVAGVIRGSRVVPCVYDVLVNDTGRDRVAESRAGCACYSRDACADDERRSTAVGWGRVKLLVARTFDVNSRPRASSAGLATSSERRKKITSAICTWRTRAPTSSSRVNRNASMQFSCIIPAHLGGATGICKPAGSLHKDTTYTHIYIILFSPPEIVFPFTVGRVCLVTTE